MASHQDPKIEDPDTDDEGFPHVEFDDSSGVTVGRIYAEGELVAEMSFEMILSDDERDEAEATMVAKMVDLLGDL